MNFEKIGEYLDSLETRGIPSVDLIISQNHRQLYRHMNGTVDAQRTRPVTADNLYIMFSMTKVQTMTALMQLVESGKVSLEDEVSEYLPAFTELKVMGENGEVYPAKNKLKLKHLASMQSGLDYNLERPGILRVLKEKGSAAGTRDIVDSFAEDPLKFEPGTHFLYSLSHDVAAAVIEVASGRKFDEYLEENIWKPLGMKNTFFAKPLNNDARITQQHILTEAGIVPMEQSCNYQFTENYRSGGAGLISSTEDYAKLADAIACGGVNADGVRILKPESIDIIKTNLLCEDGLKDIITTMGRFGYGYGVGMQIFMNPGQVGSPAPAGIFGWDGAAGSCIQMDTASGISFVFTMHVRNCGYVYGEVHPKLRDMIFG